MQVYVAYGNEILDIKLSADSTVEDLKESIAKVKKLNVDDMQLSSKGEILVVNDLLYTLGIRSGDTLQLQIVKEGDADMFLGSDSLGGRGAMPANIMGGAPVSERYVPPEVQPMPQQPLPEPPRPDPETVRKVNKLVDMGFDEDQAMVALGMAKGVVQVAASMLPLTAEEMRVNVREESKISRAQPRPAYSDGSVPGRETQMGQKIIDFNNLPDNPKDEILRDKFFSLAFDTKKRDALEITMKELIPGLSSITTTGDLLNNLIEVAMNSKKLLRELGPEQKRLVKELRKEGHTDIRAARALSAVGWNKLLALQALQREAQDQRQQEVPDQRARPRGGIEANRFPGRGVSLTEGAARGNLPELSGSASRDPNATQSVHI